MPKHLVPLPNPDFAAYILGAIQKARRSIVMVNYLAEFPDEARKNDPVLAVARALAGAKKRGVEVSVFLEGSKLFNNYPFYRYLKDRGVDVWMDTSMTFIHQKVLLIDGTLLIFGSHNISFVSMDKNVEFSAATDDAQAIASFEKTLVSITKQREEIKGKGDKEFIALPADLPGRVFRPLQKCRGEHLLNLYLLICLEDRGTPSSIHIDCERWCKLLGLDVKNAGKGTDSKYRRYYYTARMGRLVGQLRRLKLVEVDRRSDTVKRTPPPKDSEARGSIKIPLSFWTKGCWRKFSLAAKYFYIISIIETKDSPFYPWWSLPQWKMEEKYRSWRGGLAKGACQLEKLGVLETIKSLVVKRGERYTSEAKYYRLNPL